MIKGGEFWTCGNESILSSKIIQIELLLIKKGEPGMFINTGNNIQLVCMFECVLILCSLWVWNWTYTTFDCKDMTPR